MALFGFGKRRSAEERAAGAAVGTAGYAGAGNAAGAVGSIGGTVGDVGKNEFTSEGRGAEILTAILGGSGRITAETAMQIPAVARCVHMAAQAAAMLPVKMYRKNAGSVEEITDDRRVFMLNCETGDSIPGAYMRYRWVCDLLLTGSAYGYIERGGGKADRIFYVSPKDVGVIRNTEDVIHKDYRYSVRGKIYYPFEFLKILRCTDGYGKGRGIVEENPLVLDTAFSLLKFQRNQLAKGGAKKGFLKSDSQRIGNEAIEELRDRWRRLYSNEDTENIMILNKDIDFRELSNSPVEMQVNENMQTVNGEILRLFGSESGLLDENTVKNAVMPVLDILETAFDSDLLTEEEKGRVYFAFDTKELTRGDIGARFAAYGLALDKGFMQIDEVRAQEDLPPTGMTFMKLNQADVLYDPETKRIYVLNSNKWFSFGEGEASEGGQEIAAPENVPGTAEESELRYNENHDDKGRFASGGSGNSASKGLTNGEKRDILKSKIDSGELPLKIRTQKQNAHIKGTREYIKGNSYLTIDTNEIQAAINEKHLTGKVYIVNGGKHIRERIECDKAIGVNVDKEKGIEEATSKATIHYSKSGTHLVPAHPKEKKHD